MTAVSWIKKYSYFLELQEVALLYINLVEFPVDKKLSISHFKHYFAHFEAWKQEKRLKNVFCTWHGSQNEPKTA